MSSWPRFLHDDEQYMELRSGVDRRWWALYTKARHEKAVAERLAAYHLPFYLPLVRKTTLCRGRKFHSQVPLFANYLFLLGDDEERVQALTTNRISHILAITDPDRFRRELLQIARLIDTDAPLTPERLLGAGQEVRVRSGPLAGLEGRVLVRRGKTRLLVSVNYLQQGASVEIDDFLLEAA